MIGGLEFPRQLGPVVHTWGVDPFNAQGMVSYKRELRTAPEHVFESDLFVHNGIDKPRCPSF